MSDKSFNAVFVGVAIIFFSLVVQVVSAENIYKGYVGGVIHTPISLAFNDEDSSSARDTLSIITAADGIGDISSNLGVVLGFLIPTDDDLFIGFEISYSNFSEYTAPETLRLFGFSVERTTSTVTFTGGTYFGDGENRVYAVISSYRSTNDFILTATFDTLGNALAQPIINRAETQYSFLSIGIGYSRQISDSAEYTITLLSDGESDPYLTHAITYLY